MVFINKMNSSSPTPSIDSLNGPPGSGSASSTGTASSHNGDHSSSSSAESGIGCHSLTSTLSNGGLNHNGGHGSSASSSGLGSSPQLRNVAAPPASASFISDFSSILQLENGLGATGINSTSLNGGMTVAGMTANNPPNLDLPVPNTCHVCKVRECVARCRRGCATFLCAGCIMTHMRQCMHSSFDLSNSGGMSSLSGKNDSSHLEDIDVLSHLIQDARAKAQELKNSAKTVESQSTILKSHFIKAQNEVNETFQYFSSILEERKAEIMRELETTYSNKQVVLTVFGQRATEAADAINKSNELFEVLLKAASKNEICLMKRPIEKKYSTMVSTFGDTLSSYTSTNVDNVTNFEFVQPSYAALQSTIKNNFGFIRIKNPMDALEGMGTKQPPISRPISSSASTSMTHNSLIGNGFNTSLGGSSSSTSNFSSGFLASGILAASNGDPNLSSFGSAGLLDRQRHQQTPPAAVGGYQLNSLASLVEDNSLLTNKRYNRLGPILNDFATPLNGHSSSNPYEKWSNGTDKQLIFNGGASPMDALASSQNDHPQPMLDLSSKLLQQPTNFPPKSQIKRQKMIYHCKFGEFGVLEGQFTEPSGVAVNAQNDIIVADTNNHRIQIFDKEGRFKFQFGECGKRDGQLLYPNRVAVVRQSGDIIVTERSPTHQVQIYNQYGQFVRKFGANILQHPRGVCVDNNGRIIVVECKVMRVIIFDQLGNVLNKFGCSKHLEFPNGVVVNDRQEIFISDNRAHCVKVFNYDGTYLRQIGGEGITNYPIGVGINSSGEVTIADNHNNFNLSVFSQDGSLLSALESKVKHAQCFDVSLMDDGSVVLASKDYRLYIYRYVQASSSIGI